MIVYLIALVVAVVAMIVVWKKLNRRSFDFSEYNKKSLFDTKEQIAKIAQTTPVIKPKEEKIKQIDILKALKFQSDILFEECGKNDSSIFINFPDQMPRIYGSNIINISNAIYDICQFFLQNIKEPVFLKIEFGTPEIKKIAQNVKFTINIGVDKELKGTYINTMKTVFASGKKINDQYLLSAQNHLNNTSSIINFNNNKAGTYIQITTSATFFEGKNELLGKRYKYHVLIAHKTREVFDDLRAFFASVGCDVVPNPSWENTQNHLNDMIYSPDFVVIDAEYLRTDSNIVNYLNSINKDEISFAFLCKNNNSAKALAGLNFNFFRLNMPYFHDELYAILELTKHIKTDKNFLDFE